MPTLEQTFFVSCRTLSLWGAPVLWSLVLVPRMRRSVMLAIALVYAGSAAWAVHVDPELSSQLLLFMAALVYFTVLGAALHTYRATFRSQLTRPALLLVMMLLFLLFPSLFWPQALGAAFLPFAWETALAAYSYTVESDATPSTRSDCLFFLLVDPTLVYLPGERATPSVGPMHKMRAVSRVGCGLLLSGPASLLFADRSKVSAALFEELPPYLAPLAQGALLFTAFYLAHSALASIRIGVVRLLGYDVPERYRYPFLATSPMDFWARWNTYVGAWFKYYVFFPVCTPIRRTRLRKHAPQLAMLITMLSVGALHDAYVYADSLRVSLAFTRAFAVGGLLMIAWQGTGSLLRRTSRTERSPGWWLDGARALAVAPLVWLCFAWFSP